MSQNKENRVLRVNTDSEGERLDLFLANALGGVSRSRIQKLINEGLILLDNKMVSKKVHLKEGDTVTISDKALTGRETELKPQDIPLEIIYEDEFYLAVNKPAGLVVHPGNGVPDGTLVNALLFKSGKLSSGFSSERPGIVHRLDKDTSGVVIAAKTDVAHAALARKFQCRTIEKTYAGFCIGMPASDHGNIDIPLERSRREPIKRTASKTGKAAKTEYWLLIHRAGISAIRFKPYTGRTHQIRVHCSSTGIPILADIIYGGGKDRLLRVGPADRPFAYSIYKCFSRHALHAQTLSFKHPMTDEMVRIEAPLPGDFLNAIRLFGTGDLF